MAEGESGEKKHAPTERRLRQAAEKGDIQRSQELPKAAAIALITVLALYAAAGLGEKLLALLSVSLSQAGTAKLTQGVAWSNSVFSTLFPLLALIAMVGLVASFVSGGWVFALNLLQIDLSKLMPQSGLKQVFSKHGLTEHAKSILKFVAIGGVGGWVVLSMHSDFVMLIGEAAPQPSMLLASALHVLSLICLVLIVLAAADLGLKIWQHRQKLRMSDAEIREEMKEAAGNPHVKSRQRAMARRMARARQMQRIPEASVVVTNPTHYACAIRYRRGTDRAPLLLAKGADLLAEEIIARARGLGIPVVESPPLARAVYRHVEPEEHVPVALYRACAEILAYVWRLQRWRSQGGEKPRPPKPQDHEFEISKYKPE